MNARKAKQARSEAERPGEHRSKADPLTLAYDADFKWFEDHPDATERRRLSLSREGEPFDVPTGSPVLVQRPVNRDGVLIGAWTFPSLVPPITFVLALNTKTGEARLEVLEIVEPGAHPAGEARGMQN